MRKTIDRLLPPHAWAGLCILSSLSAAVRADSVEDVPSTTLPVVQVTATPSHQDSASISGLGNLFGWKAPVQAESFSQQALEDIHASRLSDLARIDASVSDNASTIGFWDILNIRGFKLDNAHNYLREGLPINAETLLPLDNKSHVELFKGTSGMQAGSSSPGGLVNLLVKRPQEHVAALGLSYTQSGNVLSTIDVGDRFGPVSTSGQRAVGSWGVRINAANERLNSPVANTAGHRSLLAVATDIQLRQGQTLEFEIEHSQRSQVAVPGFSILGKQVPSASSISPNINLNNQAWTQPVNLNGNTGTLRWRSQWNENWTSAITYGEQQLRTDNRAAFPFGCIKEFVFTHFCGDGSFDVYDFQSNGETRTTRVLLGELVGYVSAGGLQHQLNFSVQRQIHATDTRPYANQWVGQSNISGTLPALAGNNSTPLAGTNRHERSSEFTLRDSITFNDNWRAWGGLRHSRIRRQSFNTDGSNATQINRNVTTPWLAVGYTLAPKTQAYASWGEGVELAFADGNNRYSNAGQILPTLKSRQLEVGIKGQTRLMPPFAFSRNDLDGWSLNWGADLFQIIKPQEDKVNNAYVVDGKTRHRGLEANARLQHQQWFGYTSLMLIKAERSGSSVSERNGQVPVNVPINALTLGGGYTFHLASSQNGDNRLLTLQANIVREGHRWLDDANSMRIPSWTRTDLGLNLNQTLAQRELTWRLHVQNVFDVRAWQTAPHTYGHMYLFPLASRTVTVSLEAKF